MLKTLQNTRFLTILAVTALVGCQQPVGTPTPFGVDVTSGNATAALPAALTGGTPMPSGSYVPNELIVQLSDAADAGTALEGFELRASVRLSRRFAAVALPADMSLSDAYDELAARPNIEAVSLNLIMTGTVPESSEDPEPRISEQWAHRVTGLEQYWKTHGIATASNVVVAVLDSGIAPGHPEFAGRLVAPQNFTDESDKDPNDPIDRNSHGTHVAGIIGARGDIVVGVAPDVKIMPIKVLGASGGGSTMSIVQGMAYAMGLDMHEADPRQEFASRVRVMNMSLGSRARGRNILYEAAITEATKRGILVVVAAGNDALEVASPANSEGVLAVSSTSPYQLGDRIWEWLSGFSNRGERIDLAAPGGQMLSTLPNYAYGKDAAGRQNYGNMSGTSMAAPFVSGVAALVAAKFPPDPAKSGNETYMAAYVSALKQHLYATSDDLGAPGKDPKYGHGRVNALKALTTPFVYPK